MKHTILFFLISAVAMHAEDWTTSDGKIYKDIKVLKIEADAVTILDSNGGARIDLAKMPAELQKRFSYDPDKAKVATDQRASQLKASEDAISQEKAVAAAKKKTSFATPIQPQQKTADKESIKSQIKSLQQQITSLETEASNLEAAKQKEFESVPNTHGNQFGQTEHKYTMGHSQQAEDDRSQIAALQQQIVGLQQQLN